MLMTNFPLSVFLDPFLQGRHLDTFLLFFPPCTLAHFCSSMPALPPPEAMASTANLGLRALISACKFCPFDTCNCTDKILEMVNEFLDPAHQVDQKTFDAICHDLDKHPHSRSFPTVSPGDEKQRDDGEFERLAYYAFTVSHSLKLVPRPSPTKMSRSSSSPDVGIMLIQA